MAFLNNDGLTHLWAKIVAKLSTKVDKVDGKGLSTNDYTTAEKNKLAGIAEGANKTIVDSAMSSTSTNPVQNKVVNTAIANVKSLVGDTAVSTQISNAITAQKGVASGIATLDSTGKVPSSQLPSYVDDVIEGYYSSSKFYNTKGSDGTYSGEIVGETGKIYVDLNTNKTYRWSGSAYAVISETLALGTTSSTAFRGDYGNTAYNHATAKGSAFSAGLYKITTNAQGHVTAATAVKKADITGLGIPAQDTTYSVATTSANGLMSSSDKTKLDGIATGATKVTVDSALSTSSTNPVQNKLVTTEINSLKTLVGDTAVATQITNAIANKVDKVSGKGLSTNDYTTNEKNKLSGIASGAEVNQNAFSNIVVGSTTVAADSKTDTVTFVAGKNVTITPDATNDKITIAAADVAVISNADIDSICV